MATMRIETRIAGLGNLAHAARTDEREDFVGASLVPADSGM
jgi:hypothetical protein